MISRIALTALSVALTAAAAAPALADEAPPVAGTVVPERDTFYSAPADLGSYRNGQLVSSREVGARLAVAVRAWQLAFRTNDSHGNPVLGVTTVLVPVAPWTGPGARPAVSEQIAEDSTGTRCAPSYGIATGNLQSGDQITAMLQKGWAVVVPDFEGPNSAFLAGPQAGHAVLDSVRAVGQFDAAGLGPETPWGLDGFSGGAAASAWAAELQPSYAPELVFVGAAVGGVPANLPVVMRNVDGGMYSGFLMGVTVSYQREFPESGIGDMLNERGRADTVAAADLCVVDLLIRYPFRRLSESTAIDPYRADSPLMAALQRNSLGATAPRMPIYDYHSDADDVVPVGQADDLVSAWRRGGATVVTSRVPTGSHVQEAGRGQAPAQQFLAERFAGGDPVADADLDRPVGR
ncbi:lipase family protein [Nocardia sp. NPDC059229]|uniref:lipase family protein n=1 Tax=Nocardia sp. NPDC059229 TaxID=3346778 RepID=UPI00368E8262